LGDTTGLAVCREFGTAKGLSQERGGKSKGVLNRRKGVRFWGGSFISQKREG